jgi:hypothetical protein
VLSAALAVTAAAVAVVETAPDGAARTPLLVLAAGIVALASGTALRGRDRPLLGALVLAAGVAGVGAGVGLGVVDTSAPGARLRLLPGLVGVALVGAAVAPLRGAGSRRLLKLGVAAVFVGVLAAGVLRALAVGPALVASVGAVLAWDLGEHAVGVGEHLGRAAGTLPIQVTHAAGSLVVGGVAVFAGRAVAGVGPASLSLPGLVLVLAAVLSLSLALHG